MIVFFSLSILLVVRSYSKYKFIGVEKEEENVRRLVVITAIPATPFGVVVVDFKCDSIQIPLLTFDEASLSNGITNLWFPISLPHTSIRWHGKERGAVLGK